MIAISRLSFGILATGLALAAAAADAPDTTGAAPTNAATGQSQAADQPRTSTNDAQPARGHDAASAPRQFLYVLRVAAARQDPASWTAADNDAVSRHFERLKAAAATGQVILAGRTAEPLDRTFGLVIFLAPDEDAARRYMEADPAVQAGVMTASLHPYSIAVSASR